MAAYVVDLVVLAAVLLPIAFATGTALGTEGLSGPDIYLRALAMVSLPSWAYFILTDRLADGRSAGKRVLGLRTTDGHGDPPSWGQAIVRTAVKLLPWELVHLAFFGLSASFAELSPIQVVLGGAAYLLMAIYLVVPLRFGGERGVQDLAAGTRVLRV
ncbi:MAG TPA: RDD family protein [Candidatus Limnocylindria bacterium]|nr:RDD family protein [Candidatus Limnocylindria bacterium]